MQKHLVHEVEHPVTQWKWQTDLHTYNPWAHGINDMLSPLNESKESFFL